MPCHVSADSRLGTFTLWRQRLPRYVAPKKTPLKPAIRSRADVSTTSAQPSRYPRAGCQSWCSPHTNTRARLAEFVRATPTRRLYRWGSPKIPENPQRSNENGQRQAFRSSAAYRRYGQCDRTLRKSPLRRRYPEGHRTRHPNAEDEQAPSITCSHGRTRLGSLHTSEKFCLMYRSSSVVNLSA
jgi:hypothetical protein